jgi:DinB superfamily
MIDDVRRMLVRELSTFAREIELFPDDESVWKTAPGITNSAGNLALHACGNLKHFVGAVLGDTGYVRNREAEFATRAGTREDLVREIRWTRDIVEAVLPRLQPSVLAAPFPEPVGGVELPCDRFLLHLAVHLSFHLGQASYLRRFVTGDARSSGPVAVAALAGLSSASS